MSRSRLARRDRTVRAAGPWRGITVNARCCWRTCHRSGGRTIGTWRDQIVAWHQAHVSNGPTEAINNLVKRVKRTAFGFFRRS